MANKRKYGCAVSNDDINNDRLVDNRATKPNALDQQLIVETIRLETNYQHNDVVQMHTIQIMQSCDCIHTFSFKSDSRRSFVVVYCASKASFAFSTAREACSKWFDGEDRKDVPE